MKEQKQTALHIKPRLTKCISCTYFSARKIHARYIFRTTNWSATYSEYIYTIMVFSLTRERANTDLYLELLIVVYCADFPDEGRKRDLGVPQKTGNNPSRNRRMMTRHYDLILEAGVWKRKPEDHGSVCHRGTALRYARPAAASVQDPHLRPHSPTNLVPLIEAQGRFQNYMAGYYWNKHDVTSRTAILWVVRPLWDSTVCR